MNITSRLPDVGTTIFTVMSRLAAEHGAINLSQGFPDFSIDPQLSDLVNVAMAKGHNQYAQMEGVIELRRRIAQMLQRSYNVQINPESEITITAGATEALFSVIAAFVSPGDEVILFDPAYDSYSPAIRLTGGVPVHISLRYPQFKIDWDEVDRSVTNRTKMIVVNTPHNPLGTVLDYHDMTKLDKLAERHNLIVLSDEVYERLVYDGQPHQSVLRFPNLFSRSLACFSFGKTLHATGWKVGYVVGRAGLMKEVRKTHQYITFSVNTPMQYALAGYLDANDTLHKIRDFYQKKRDLFLEQIKGSSFEPLPCRGSYFQLLSYQSISSKSDEEMAIALTRYKKIASIPVSVFYRDRVDAKILRFCFAKKDETLIRAGEILRRI